MLKAFFHKLASEGKGKWAENLRSALKSLADIETVAENTLGPVAIAAGNEGDEYLNIYALANRPNVVVVGARADGRVADYSGRAQIHVEGTRSLYSVHNEHGFWGVVESPGGTRDLQNEEPLISDGYAKEASNIPPSFRATDSEIRKFPDPQTVNVYFGREELMKIDTGSERGNKLIRRVAKGLKEDKVIRKIDLVKILDDGDVTDSELEVYLSGYVGKDLSRLLPSKEELSTFQKALIQGPSSLPSSLKLLEFA